MTKSLESKATEILTSTDWKTVALVAIGWAIGASGFSILLAVVGGIAVGYFAATSQGKE